MSVFMFVIAKIALFTDIGRIFIPCEIKQKWLELTLLFG